MWLMWVVSALAGGSCEAMCGKLGACLGDTSPAALGECATSCANRGVSPPSIDAILAAPTCEAAVMALATAASQLPAAAPAATAPPSAPASAAGVAPDQCHKPSGDARVVQLLTNSAWCSYSFVGSTETRGRVVFRPDGSVVTTERRESI